MRHFFLAMLLTAPIPAMAWEFASEPICTLRHMGADGSQFVVTYDPGAGLYALEVTRAEGSWAGSASFGMRFTGGASLTIGTARHITDGPRLRVTDRGFGNVLDGLEFNTRALAFTETQRVEVSLLGAAKPVQDFRACVQTPPLGV